MNALRWIIAFPVTMMLSGIAWMLVKSLFHGVYYGGGVFERIYGISPLIISGALPTMLFVFVGVLLAPSKGRKIVFVFFALGILCSGGGMNLVESAQIGFMPFWWASLIGVVLGALLGLFASLGLQNIRQRRAIQSATANALDLT